MKKINVAILGSTGSIGINTLKVIERYSKRFRVVALTAFQSYDLLARQAALFKPDYVASAEEGLDHLKKVLDTKKTRVCHIDRDLEMIASLPAVDIVVIAMRGSAALMPFLAAVRAGKRVAPANKEALVVAGDFLMDEAKRCGATIIPIDSEQSAIFQCLQGQDRSFLKKIHLTASGGTLRLVPRNYFDRLSVREILSHPRWKMGPKITVDSASLMNKGFEVIEAQRLFGLKAEEIEVLIHPEAIIHSMVEFKDGSVIAQMGVTDMRLPIQYALTYPERMETGLSDLDLTQIKNLSFAKPDLDKFPSLRLAYFVAQKGGTLPSVLNAADEEAVEAFLNGQIKFTKIYDIVEKVVLSHRNKTEITLTSVLEADQWARQEARKYL